MKFITPFIVALLATIWSVEASSQGCKPVTFDGYTYDVVQISNQCWFAENLRTEHYANGDEIPGDLSDAEWEYTDLGARAVYGEGESSREELLANLNTYGGLYNWHAVDDARGLCPSGWHVPTDEEWMTLEMELGMSESEAKYEGRRGTDQGPQMKSSPSDNVAWDGTNTSGFSALAGGFRDANGGFYGEEYSGCFWSSSPNGEGAWFRLLSSGNSGVDRPDGNRRDGFTVRCLKDSE